jgi:hypothetical protein
MGLPTFRGTVVGLPNLFRYAVDRLTSTSFWDGVRIEGRHGVWPPLPAVLVL